MKTNTCIKFLLPALVALPFACSVFAQTNRQTVDSLQQRIEEVQQYIDTTTIIAGLDQLLHFYEWNRVMATDHKVWSLQTRPKYQGGDPNTFSAWVNKNLVQQYDENNNPLEGRVTLSFVVSETGEITNVRVLRGAHPKLNQEAVRVVSSSPRWTPGSNAGITVPYTYQLPVVFQAR